MSVTTTADERIDSARQNISQAYKDLLVVLDEDTWGHDDFKSSYIETLHEVAAELIKLKGKL